MITIADVAERAGVSKTTVSHALSGKRHVAPATRKRIEEVIEELGFRPNALARSLRIQRTQMVTLIIPDITNPYYPVLARGLQDALIKHGYHIFLCNTDGDKEQSIELIADAIHRQVDGIVVSSLHPMAKEIEEFLTEDVPFISLGVSVNHPQIDQVATDDRQGALIATRYLLDQGHQRVGMISGPFDMTPGKERHEGYQEALAEAQLRYDSLLVVEGDFMRQSGKTAMHALMKLTERPTAIFCANDLMAIGAMDTARELGIAIPHDIAIVGYDDIEAASLVTPALTTIFNPAYEMGQTAGQMLLERMNGTYQGPGRKAVVPHRFIQRESA